MDTLKSCNYRECYKKQFAQGISFIEKGEVNFPKLSDECEVFMTLGNSCRSEIAFIGKDFPCDEDKNAICTYTSEACLNGYIVTLRSLFGSTYSALNGAFIAGGRVRVIADMGLSLALKKYRYLVSSVLINDGQILSPFEPDIASSRETARLCDSLIESIPLIVFFSFTKREYILACNALDRGNDIVIHRNALKYKYARRLVVEGAIVTDSFSDLLIRCGKTPNGYLYFDKDKNPIFLKI